ncbi:MAG: CapA family protein, partial [Ilumatobacteraceae bacterium]
MQRGRCVAGLIVVGLAACSTAGRDGSGAVVPLAFEPSPLPTAARRSIAPAASEAHTATTTTMSTTQVTTTPSAPSGAASVSGVALRGSVPAPSVTFAFTGDTLLHTPIIQAAATANGYDFAPMFAEIAPAISWADVGVCHLETPIAPDGEGLSTYPLYGVPAAIAPALAGAGYDRCSTASNHTMDRGTAGIDATVAALERAGVAESGMARTPTEAIPATFEVHGIRIAHLSFTFGLNGLRTPANEPWRTNLLDAGAVIASAAEARERGAQVVIASIHWGIEGQSTVTPQQRQIAEAITASHQVDVIVGHHAHVVQPIEQINGHWVVFGLGNILSNLPTGEVGRYWPPSAQDGVIVTLRITQTPE